MYQILCEDTVKFCKQVLATRVMFHPISNYLEPLIAERGTKRF